MPDGRRCSRIGYQCEMPQKIPDMSQVAVKVSFAPHSSPQGSAYPAIRPMSLIGVGRITEPTRQAVQRWIEENGLRDEDYVFPSRVKGCAHLSTRQYARKVNRWVACIGLDPHRYGTHPLRQTKAALIYKKTGNLRAVQLLLGHTKVESTVRYLGIDADDALQISEQVEL
jgi:integrase